MTQNRLISEKKTNTVTNTLNQNEIRSIRSSLLIGPVATDENNAFEQAINIEHNSNEFDNFGYYDDYEYGFETTEVSTTDKYIQSMALNGKRKSLNASSLITNIKRASEKSKVKGSEGMKNDSHDCRVRNDVSC